MRWFLSSLILNPFGVYLGGFTEVLVFIGILIATVALTRVIEGKLAKPNDGTGVFVLWLIRLFVFAALWFVVRCIFRIHRYLHYRLRIIFRVVVILVVIAAVITFFCMGKNRKGN